MGLVKFYKLDNQEPNHGAQFLIPNPWVTAPLPPHLAQHPMITPSAEPWEGQQGIAGDSKSCLVPGQLLDVREMQTILDVHFK